MRDPSDPRSWKYLNKLGTFPSQIKQKYCLQQNKKAYFMLQSLVFQFYWNQAWAELGQAEFSY